MSHDTERTKVYTLTEPVDETALTQLRATEGVTTVETAGGGRRLTVTYDLRRTGRLEVGHRLPFSD